MPKRPPWSGSRKEDRSGLFRRLAPSLEPGFLTIERMTIRRMEHIGNVVDNLAATPANTPGIRHVAVAVEDIDAVGLRVRDAE